MASTVSGTGSISSTGIGSGLDVEAIISKTMAVEDAPLTDLQNAATKIQTTISAFGAVQSALSSFRDASRALTDPSTWSAVTATSADPSSVTVSTGAGAVAGSYSISVQTLAASQSTVSPTYTAGTALVGAGSLHIDLSGATGFTTPPTGGVDIAVTATDTLATLNDKINAASAGVSSSIVTDATGSRLVLSSSTTGTANQFRVTGTDSDGGTGLAALSFDPTSATVGPTKLTQAAADAKATVNGLTVTSGTNTLSNVLQGLTINLQKLTTTPVQVTVAQDTASIKTQITAFVTAYNALSSLLATDTAYDATSKTAGPLQADSTAVSLQRQLRSVIGSSSGASSAFQTLSQAGLQLQTDGTLKINDSTLTNALGNSTQLKAMFMSTSGATMADNGFAQQFNSLTNSDLATDGLLTTRVAGLNKSLTKNQDDQDALNVRLAAVETRLRAQYTALDSKMATITTLSTYITQQIANWNKST
jgi:flagellar hook-associated protein 2